jgi:hypothetical protein
LRPRRGRRTDDLGKGGNANHVGQMQNVDNAMIAAIANIAATEQYALNRAGQSLRLDRPNAVAAGDERKRDGPIAGLYRHRKIIAAEQPRGERQSVGKARTRRHTDDPGEVGVARQNAFRSGKYQCVDRGLWIGVFEAPDKRCRQQYVAEAAQDNHQHSRIMPQPKRIHCCAIDECGDMSSSVASADRPRKAAVRVLVMVSSRRSRLADNRARLFHGCQR